MYDNIFGFISYGLYILTSSYDGRDSGSVINTLMQTSSDPLTVCICVKKASYTCELVQKSSKFTVSMLNTDTSFETIKRFGFCSGRDTDKFADFSDCERALNGCYVITKETNSYMCVRVTQQTDLGSHILFIGTPSGGEKFNDVPSLTYAYYNEHIKQVPQSDCKAPEGCSVWKCSVCGHEYTGKELPENYICPVCGHPASDFRKL